MDEGANVSALSRELGVRRKSLYDWRARHRWGGAEALRGCGRPRQGEAGVVGERRPRAPVSELGAALERIVELERKIGQQQVELDFFRQALRQVKAARRGAAAPGVRGSTRSSKR
jgi:transposase-like protein